MEVAVLGRVELRGLHLSQLGEIGARHVAQRAPLLHGQVGDQVALCQHGVHGLCRVVDVDSLRREVVDDEGCRTEALVEFVHGLLLVLDDGAAVDVVVVADELRQVAHAVGLHQAHACVPNVF